MAFRWLKNYHVLSFRRGKEGEFQSERRHQSPPKISPLSSLPAQKFRIPRAIAVGVSARIENGGMGTKLCCGVARSRNSRSIYPEFMARLQSMPAYPDNRINCARLKRRKKRATNVFSRFRLLYTIIDRTFFGGLSQNRKRLHSCYHRTNRREFSKICTYLFVIRGSVIEDREGGQGAKSWSKKG